MFFNHNSQVTNQPISPADQQRNIGIPENFSQAQQCAVRKNRRQQLTIKLTPAPVTCERALAENFSNIIMILST